MTQYFLNNADPAAIPPVANNWTMNVLIDGRNPQDPTVTTPLSTTVEFNGAGQLGAVTQPLPASLMWIIS